jgi:hypothetical protein
MPESIVIPLDAPIQIPSSPAKQFEAMWITQVLVRTLLPTDQSGGGLVAIEFVPMNAQTGEILPEPQSISSDRLMQAVAEVPEVAQAMGAILLAIQPLKAWLASQQQNPQE